jgi:ubiquinone/menaquinone biosynthesis C-methylase UbiE
MKESGKAEMKNMARPVVVKRDMQKRYDDLGEAVRKNLDVLRDPAHVWRLVEGDRPALAYFRGRKIETALELGSFPARSALVEVGCGTGDYSLLLARAGYRMTGVDLSSKSIEAARTKASILGVSGTSFVVSDAEALSEIPTDSADGVVSFSALRYVPDARQALLAIRRVLKPNGVAVLDFPNRLCPWFRMLKTHFGVERHIHDQHYSTSEIVTLMREAGLVDVTARRILFTTYVLPAPLLPLFRAIDWVGERTPGISQTAGIIMVRGRKA